jgi:hypothetical protein
MQPNPGVFLHDVQFAERPHILKCGDSYYLRYRIAIKHGTVPPLRMVLCSRKGRDKGYYYFSVPISHPESGHVIERALADDQLTEFARRNAVYWLNPDGSEIRLEVEEGPDAS